jgi:hypothetical protein
LLRNQRPSHMTQENMTGKSILNDPVPALTLLATAPPK